MRKNHDPLRLLAAESRMTWGVMAAGNLRKVCCDGLLGRFSAREHVAREGWMERMGDSRALGG